MFANRIYLTKQLPKAFSQEEVEIAGHLGVGLIRITGTKCHEELSSPHYRPITRMNLLLIEKLGLGVCQLCGTVFATSQDPKRNNYSNLHKKNLIKAVNDERGLMFWNYELADRKNKSGIRMAKDTTYERRFFCPDCVRDVLGQFLPDDE